MSASCTILEGVRTLAYTHCLHSGPEWHDGHHDAGPRVRHSWCGRGHVLCRDHEVRHGYPLRTPLHTYVVALPVKKNLNGQACQIDGILRNCVRHGSNWTHTTLSLFSYRTRKGAGEVIHSEWAYRTNAKSGMLKGFFLKFSCLEAMPSIL